MTDLNKEFRVFHEAVALYSTKKAELRRSRDAIRDRIRSYCKNVLQIPVPKFRGQGSYSMGTTVNPQDHEFDIDDGVYLLDLNSSDTSNWPTPETVHRWIVSATEGHTKEKPVDKKICVRVRYAGQYHVDLPIYGEKTGEYLLAEKGEKGWHRSDPLALSTWFLAGVKLYGEQLRRIVRLLKAWADFQSGRRGKMPSGLILTVLAVQNFRHDDADDVCFSETVHAIGRAISPIFRVTNPVDETEELTARLSEIQKARFQEAVSELSSIAEQAIDMEDAEQASKLWRNQFGDRFPAIEKDFSREEFRQAVAASAATYIGKQPPKPWAPNGIPLVDQ
ncbi:MAG: hypothetical protein K9K88_14480 [Desulfobacterales bacterium]|nr:hypothetical protein [Desulfobacterales bacterium]